MLDKVLVDIAKENNLKVTTDTVFGLYKGQLISLSFASNNQYIVVVGLDESKDLVDTLSTKENKKALKSKLRSIHINVQKEGILFNGIPCGLREKTRYEKLSKMLDEVCLFLADFQNYEGTDINNIILLGNAPVVRSDDVIAKTKQELKQEREKEIDYQKGFLIASLGIIVGSCFAGLASGLMNIKLNSDLNAFGKAIFVVLGAAFLYQKITNGVDRASKWLIGAVATLGFMTWEISRYATVMKYKGVDFTFNSLVELFQKNINFETVIGRFTLLSLGTIWVWVFFFVKRSDTVIFTLEEGQFINDEKFTEFELASKGNWYSGFLFFGGFILIMACAFLSISVYEDFSYFEYLPFYYIAGLSHGLLWFLFKILRRKSPALDATMKTYGLTKMPNWFDPLLTHICLALFSGAMAFSASWINMKYDVSEEKLIPVKLTEVYSNSNACQWLDVEPEGMDKLSLRFCKTQYGFLDKKIEGLIHYRKGFLKIPYALSVSFPALDSFKGYIETVGKIDELRKFNIIHFYKKDKSKEFKNEIEGWDKLCETDQGAYCRFASYIYAEKKEVKREIELLKKGCSKKDAVSCYGLVLHKEISEQNKDEQIQKMKSLCKSGNGENCHYLGHSYENYKYKQNKQYIPSSFSQACKLGVKEACEH